MNNTIYWNVGKARIPGMDGLRAVAVFLMVAYHVGIPISNGGLGSMIFFVLSGFLITSLLLKEYEKNGRISFIAFYSRRALRLFPAFYFYWICLVLFLILCKKEILWLQALSSLVFLSNYYNAIYGDPNNGFSHTWTLSLQEQFYFLWPVLFHLFVSNLRRMAIFQTGLIVSVWIYRIILHFGFQVDQGYFYAAFDTRFDGIMIGCLLAVLLKHYGHHRLWQLPVRRIWYPLITLTFLSFSIYEGKNYVGRYRDFIGLALEPVLIAILLVQIIGFINRWPFKWLESPLMIYLGKISYSVYLFQQVIVYPVQKQLTNYHILVQLAAVVLVTVIIASISYYIIEKPFLTLKKKPARFNIPVSSQNTSVQPEL